jgi:hypothetical protein
LICTFSFISLSLSSLCVIYPKERSVRMKTQKRFFFLSLSSLCESSAWGRFKWILGHSFFSLSLSSLCVIYPKERSGPHENTKKVFFLVFLLYVKALLESDSNEFWDIFLVSLSLSSLCVIYPRRRSVRIKTQKQFFLVFLRSVKAFLDTNPNEFRFGAFFSFSILFSV